MAFVFSMAFVFWRSAKQAKRLAELTPYCLQLGLAIGMQRT